jgi:predicted glycosyltransferase
MRPSLLFYCQHSLGMGHLVRSLTLAAGLSQSFRVVFLNGGPLPEGMRVPGGVELVDLPPLGFDAGMQLVSRNHRVSVDSAQELRRKIILDSFRWLRPDIILVELFPFGRKKFAGELLPLLEEAHADASAAPLVACSLRDILVTPEDSQAARATEWATRYFDAVLVHSDPLFSRVEESFPALVGLKPSVHYTGFVSRGPNEKLERTPGNPPRIVVSAGGGLVGAPLLRCAIEAHALLGAEHAILDVICGPFLPDDSWDALSRLAGGKPAIRLRKFVPSLPEELRTASASISQCGYNTALDILRSGVPALVVPYSEGSEDEQMNRGRRLERLGALRVLEPVSLNPARLAEGICGLLHFKPQVLRLDLNGTERSAQLLQELLRGRRSGGREYTLTKQKQGAVQ